MRIKVDENLPNTVVSILSDAGHDASTVHDERLQGAKNDMIVATVQDEGHALISLDLGFADIRRHPPSEHHGIVVLRLSRQDKDYGESSVVWIAPSPSEEEVMDKLWIVEENPAPHQGMEPLAPLPIRWRRTGDAGGLTHEGVK